MILQTDEEFKGLLRQFINDCDVAGLSYAERNRLLWDYAIGKDKELQVKGGRIDERK